MGLLPGESRVEFEKLREDLVDEFAPDGALENDVVSTVARLLWRKQNLSTSRTAELARQRRNQIIDEELARRDIRYARRLCEQEKRKPATVEDRLDSAIDKCLKRLLMLKGLKSITAAPRSQTSQIPKSLSANRSAA
jgi:hypothetical protein